MKIREMNWIFQYKNMDARGAGMDDFSIYRKLDISSECDSDLKQMVPWWPSCYY